MNDTKRCGGYKGRWECADEYPDHEVPIEQFRLCTGHKSGRQGMCRKCATYRDNIANPEKNPLRAISYKLAGGFNKYYSLPREDRISVRDEAKRIHLLNTAPAAKVLEHIEKSKKPKFNQGKYKSPLARAVAKSKIEQSPGFAREGPGFVYVYEDEMKIPGVLKIGSTQYSNGRLASANTWGAFTCLYEKEFERRYEAEAMVHDILEYCRIYRDKEWFRVTLTVAIEAIGEVRIDIRKKQKVG